ncbi:hypothetical protein AAG570_010026 [Ranatra chinensis]|uniref:Cell division cycle protein 123 homolog n=1 Tax=Ranatra chinensis TaxID=642074 RepID=A0ABD0Z7J5_9HEMI
MCERYWCSFQNWYSIFKSHSIPAVFEPIPEDVLAYLREDNVVLPKEAVLDNKLPEDEDEGYYVGSVVWDEQGESDDELNSPTFPEFSQRLARCLDRFGNGCAFIKSNWSAPTDAAWVAIDSSLKCTNLQDVYLLLKSSDKVSWDLDCDYEQLDCNYPKYYVVFKRWSDIHPADEFRCFVSGSKLVAISQRDPTKFFNGLQESKLDIVSSIDRFFYNVIKDKFPLDNYTFDVVRNSAGKIKILDFGTFNWHSDPCLYTWSELEEMEYEENISPEFRYIPVDPIFI